MENTAVQAGRHGPNPPGAGAAAAARAPRHKAHRGGLRGLAATLVAVLALAIAPIAASAPAAPRVASPGDHGIDSQRLARIDAYMQDALARGLMIGGHGVIARHGQVVYDAVWGLADREQGRPLRQDALYRIYSMTKPVTSVALLMLYEEGRFLLEDPVADYLPELAGLTVLDETPDGEALAVDPRRQPTIRDLLRHTAGFTYGVFGDSAVDRLYREGALFDSPSLAVFTRRLGTFPLRFEPGTRWHYSVAVDVQARLVEVISGMGFGDFLRARIFGPLGMDDTFFVIPQDKRPRLAQLYTPAGTTLDWHTPWEFSDEKRLVVADPELTRPYLEGGVFESGGAGLVSTTADYLRFALMLAGGGSYEGVRLLAPRTVDLLRSDHTRGVDTSGLWGLEGFGLGVGIVGDPAGKHGELAGAAAYGWGGAAGTLFWVDPDADLVAVFMVQSLPHQTPLSKTFRVLTYQALLD